MSIVCPWVGMVVAIEYRCGMGTYYYTAKVIEFDDSKRKVTLDGYGFFAVVTHTDWDMWGDRYRLTHNESGERVGYAERTLEQQRDVYLTIVGGGRENLKAAREKVADIEQRLAKNEAKLAGIEAAITAKKAAL